MPNSEGALFPGMYARVNLINHEQTRPCWFLAMHWWFAVRAPALPLFARPHCTSSDLEVGRDFGDRLEILSGLQAGDTIIPNPGDMAREGLKVDPVVLKTKPPSK